MIPPEIQDYETYIVSYSGGKDSTAMLLWALDTLPRERLRVMYNSVGDGIDPPENDEYLPYIQDTCETTIHTVKAGDRSLPLLSAGRERQPWEQETSFLRMIRARGKWPAWHARYCTTYLKQWPTALWAATLPTPVINLIGQRRAESKHRAKLPYFSGKKEWKQTRDGLPVYRPILDWSEDDVQQMIKRHGILLNPVYNRSSRCNCGLCFQARPHEVFTFCRLYPGTAQKAANLEQAIGHNWTKRHSIANLLRQAQAQIPLFNTQSRFAASLPKFNRTASDPAGTTPAAPPATPLAGRQQVRQRKEPL